MSTGLATSLVPRPQPPTVSVKYVEYASTRVSKYLGDTSVSIAVLGYTQAFNAMGQ